MNPALLLLLKRRFLAAVRRGWRQFQRPQRAVLVVLGIVVFALWMLPSLLSAPRHADPEQFRSIAPLFMLLLCLMPLVTSNARQAFQFTPAEIDFLFAGPFTRRELLLVKLLGTMPGLALSAGFFWLILRNMVPSGLAVMAGGLLSLLLVQLFGMICLLVQQIVAEYAFSLVRKLALGLLVVLLVLLLGPPLMSARAAGFPDLAHSLFGRAIAVPFAPFVNAMSAASLVEFLRWGSVALAIDLALLAAVLRLDVDYNDAAIAASQALYRRKQQMQQRGGAGWMVLRSPRIRCPHLPRLGGAGPIARRQLTAGLRGIPGLAVLVLACGLPMLVAFLGRQSVQGPTVFIVAGNALFLSLLMTRMVPFDFRGDLDVMDWLKALPLPSTALAAGELAAPVLLITALQLALFSILGLVAPSTGATLLALAAFALPLNVLVFAVDNVLFLLWPARLHPSTGASFQFFGRVVAEMLAKMVVLAVASAVAALPAAAAYWIFGQSWPAALVAAWLVLLPLALGMVFVVAWSFRRLDLSLDV